MQDVVSLLQSSPWLVLGGAFILLNVILLIMKLTKKLILLGIGAALVAVGLYTGLIGLPGVAAALPGLF